jgi:molybdate transport system permease protein
VDGFVSVIMPMAVPGFLSATVLSFAHTLGEFGVVLMVGGSIPGETRVISIAIFDHVEALEYHSAHQLSALLLLTAFVVLCAMYFVHRRWSR